MKPSIGISKENIKAVVEILSSVLSDDTVLYVKTRKFHWNVSGESFMGLHL
jgi:starvation-inducible DNA-binding protein